MKTFTRWLLVLLLVAIPMMAVIQTASANSELVPASRLVAPYITNSTSTTAPVAGQATFLLISNVRWTGGNTSTAVAHMEFYDKTCVKTDRVISLSDGDTDQFNVTNAVPMATGHGWADIDVRTSPGNAADTSIQRNSLVGQVLIADSANDFAFSYPMAASVGSAASGVGGNIVTHNSSGNALVWTGRYEPFPTRIILPAYFAEQTASPAIVGFLAVASPADGNWYGQGVGNTTCTTATGCGEAPGENLTGTGDLITSTVLIWDGCEDAISSGQNGHYVSGTLQTLFGVLLNRSLWAAAPASCSSSGGSFPRKDEVSGEPVGWIDWPNTSVVKRGIAQTGVGTRTRGLVGVFFESSVGTAKLGDASRLWGDRDSITSQSGCTDSASTSSGSGPLRCKYNIESQTGTGGVPTSQP